MTPDDKQTPPMADKITLAWNPHRGVHVMPNPPHNEAVMLRDYVAASKHAEIVAALTAERDALKENFVRYGSHIVGCDALNYLPSNGRSDAPCTCGWREASR